ncbi:MAG: glycosyltransferase [Syntrophobacteraceae bacterium]
MINNEKIFEQPGEEIPCGEISDKAAVNKTPLVSVFMITYNHEPYIAQAIEGVLQQETDSPLELIIGEDCSTDRTREIVLEYQRKYPSIIRVLVSANNVGGHKNARRVYAACRGKYIAYCEGDDYWHHPLKLKKQVEYLESHPRVGMIHSDVIWRDVNTGEKCISYYKYHMLSHSHLSVLRGMIERTYVVITCSVIVRKTLLHEIYRACQYEFSEKFLMGDLPLWIEIAHRSTVKYIDEPLVTYNRLPESASRSKDIDRNIRFWKNEWEMLLHFADKYGGKDSQEIKRNLRTVRLLAVAFHYGKPDLAREVFQYSRRHGIPLGLKDYLYFIGSLSFFLSCFVKLLVLPVTFGRKLRLIIKNL